MNFKRYVEASDTWVDSHYIMGTSTDTITTLPAVLYPTGTTATVGLKGQTLQSSTPSPTSPVMPQGTGEKTGNLFDINATPTKYSQSTTVTVDGRTLTILGAWYIYYEIDVAPNTDYYVDWTIDYAETQGRGTIAILTTSGQIIKQQDLRPFRFNSGENQRIRLYIYSGNNEPATIILSNIMLNTGSTPLPYEPYGYKIPISSANTTTPVYLGEVETTRRVKKYECTGEESWQFYSDSVGTYGAWQFYANNIVNGLASSSAQSNIADYGVTATTRHMNPYGAYLVTNGTGLAFQMGGAKDTFTNVTAWKSYLAAQYAAGTPVTVWYVLATETTGIVNEPLMKIGDYADMVSNVSIPVTSGGDTISVGTTVQPSEVTVNYKGWHPVQSAHERENVAWT